MIEENPKAIKELTSILKAARKKANLTQAQVAEKSEMHVQYYAGIEQGRVNTSWDKLYKIFQTLKIKLTY